MLQLAAPAAWVMHDVTHAEKPYVALVALAGAVVVPVAFALVDAATGLVAVALALALPAFDDVVDDTAAAPTLAANPRAAMILKGMNMVVEC